ncbi:MAG: DUF721 domain-containing protein [Ignavibacteria bacterium]|nr:DUF721 domain-containing protein [Ignavibacteria bacterium]
MKHIDFKDRANKFISLEKEMENFVNELGLPEKLQELEIIRIWNECVGIPISNRTKSVFIAKNKLFVKVEDAVWRFELSLRKEEILKVFNERFQKIKPGKKIREIIFK